MNIRLELAASNQELVSPILLKGDAWLQAVMDKNVPGNEKAYILHLRGVRKRLVGQIAEHIEQGWISAIFVREDGLERCLYPVETERESKLMGVKREDDLGADGVRSRRVKRSENPVKVGWTWSHSIDPKV